MPNVISVNCNSPRREKSCQRACSTNFRPKHSAQTSCRLWLLPTKLLSIFLFVCVCFFHLPDTSKWMLRKYWYRTTLAFESDKVVLHVHNFWKRLQSFDCHHWAATYRRWPISPAHGNRRIRIICAVCGRTLWGCGKESVFWGNISAFTRTRKKMTTNTRRFIRTRYCLA